MSTATTEIIEEYEGNQKTDVEAEGPDDQEPSGIKPYDPSKIRVDPKTFSLRMIIDMIQDGDLDLAPDFQRDNVWKPLAKSRLIESILLRIPLPAFYFSADADGRLRVVDGLQRLSTVYEFVRGGEDKNGGFTLQGLEYLREGTKENVEGLYYHQLDPTWARRIHQTQIFVNVIDPQTPARVKFDIFKRLNTGGTPLNAQEIRHCMSNARSREFLKACTGRYRYYPDTELPYDDYKANGGVLPRSVYTKANAAGEAFGEATDWKWWAHVRMADRELVLRFCAFRLISEDIEQYGPATSMDEFLTSTTERLDDKEQIADNELGDLAEDLRRGMEYARELFGKYAFRKWPTGDSRLNPINRALFESWSVSLADYQWENLKPDKNRIVEDAREAMTSNGPYIDAISTGTSDHTKVHYRFHIARQILEGTGK